MVRSRSRRKSPPGYLYLIILGIILVGALFFFEWLGSEKPQRLVDKPIELPAQYQNEIDAQKAQDQSSEDTGPGAI